MFDHVTLRATDRAATERFYATVLPALGVDEVNVGPASTLYGHYELSVAQDSPERPATRGLHVGLRAPSIDAIHAFWTAGVGAGFASDGEPGPRPAYGDDYYGAFLLDPDGNSVEAVIHDNMRARGVIDHLWIRTAGAAASHAAYLQLAEFAGLDVRQHEPGELLRIGRPRGGSLTVVAGAEPTTGVHLAVPAAPATIDAWHAAATLAGLRSDGPPGFRAYHPKYYGAFVLDHEGRSLELVDHGGLLGERW